MENTRDKNTEYGRHDGMASFITAAIFFVIVYAAINAESIIHEIRIAYASLF